MSHQKAILGLYIIWWVAIIAIFSLMIIVVVVAANNLLIFSLALAIGISGAIIVSNECEELVRHLKARAPSPNLPATR